VGEPAPLIELREISKRYGEGAATVHALRSVDLDIHAGEFVAIMGPSGSGKTTLMNIIGCLDRPTAGSYRLLDEEVSSLSRADLADIRNHTLGFVFQSFNLLARTSALDNVQLPLVYGDVPRRERIALATEALERVGLGERMHHHPSELSGGQQQRVAIARAIVTKPQVILADEPTGNLDSRTSIEIIALFQELGKEGITIAYVTHEPDIARFATRILMVRDGRIESDAAQSQASAIDELHAFDARAEARP